MLLRYVLSACLLVKCVLIMVQIDVILAASRVSEEPQLNDQQKEVLEQIEKRLNEAIEKFEGDGAFIRVNDRYIYTSCVGWCSLCRGFKSRLRHLIFL